MTLADDLESKAREAAAKLRQDQVDLDDLASRLDTANGQVQTLAAQVADLTQRLADCEAVAPPSPPQPTPSPPPPLPSPPPSPVPGNTIYAGEDVNGALRGYGAGATVTFVGTFSGVQVLPFSGQTLQGGIFDGAGAPHGFGCKDAQAVGVTIDGVEVFNYSDIGIQPWIGTRVENFHVHHIASTGIGSGLEANAAGLVIAHGEVDHCGSASNLGHDSGGIKLVKCAPYGSALTDGSWLHHLDVHDNIGNGCWYDLGSAGDLVEDSHFYRNTRKGLFYEIGAGPASFRHVEADHNNSEGQSTAAGIATVSSKLVSIIDCNAHDNAKADVKVWQDSRRNPGWPLDVNISGLNPGAVVKGCDLPGVVCG